MSISRVLKTARSITVTPISYVAKSDPSTACPHSDYNVTSGDTETQSTNMVWNDAPQNNTVVGDLLAFVWGNGKSSIGADGTEFNGRADVYRVVAVLPPTHRNSLWTDTDNVRNNVLVLSEVLATGTLVELRAAAGKQVHGRLDGDVPRHAPVQKTQRWRLPQSDIN